MLLVARLSGFARPSLAGAEARAYLSAMSGGGVRGGLADMQGRLRTIFDASKTDAFKAGDPTTTIPLLAD